MRRLTALYAALDRTTRTGEKTAALRSYFTDAPPGDAVWTLRFLCGTRFRRSVSSRALRRWVSELCDVPPWLVDECYAAVGDLSETLALLLPDPEQTVDLPLHRLVAECIEPLAGHDEAGQRALVERAWSMLDPAERFVFHKLLTGAFRVGAGKRLVTRALAEVAGIEPARMAHRLMGSIEPTAGAYTALLSTDGDDPAASQPYPFYLASPLESAPEMLGPVEDWLAEWKWDGLRAQLIRRDGEVVVWSRGEEIITDGFPELAAIGRVLPEGTVLDGEILAWENERPLPFGDLQRRIGRRRVEPSLFPDVPIVLMAFDVLEHDGADQRAHPLVDRRDALVHLVETVGDEALRLSPEVALPTWAACVELKDTARERGTEGLILKRRAAPYGVGRQRGAWWKWKVDPYTVDVVLIYAQPGSGRRASLYTDYTFGVWDGDELVPVAKAYSGLTDEEIHAVDRHVRRTTVDRHGPVRVVAPELVFELAFEGIQESNRHRCGIALRFPRMARWRHDKLPRDADTLRSLRRLLGDREQ